MLFRSRLYAHAQEAEPRAHEHAHQYVRHRVYDLSLIHISCPVRALGTFMVPARDGVRLATDVYVPGNAQGPVSYTHLDVYKRQGDTLGEHVWSLILPAFTQSLGISALLIRNICLLYTSRCV